MFEFLKYLSQKKTLFFAIQITVLIISIVVSFFFLKPWYRSGSKILVTADNSNSLMSVISNSLPIGLTGFGGTDVSKYLAILSTNRVADSVINKFKLHNVYANTFYDYTIKDFKSNLGLIDNDDNTLSITFDYENNPKIAAEIVQYIYEVLYEITRSIEQKTAKDYSNYIQKYLAEKRVFLKLSEDSLANLQKNKKLLEPTIQSQFIFEKISAFEKKKIEAEIMRFAIYQSKGKNNFEVQSLNNQINFFSTKIKELTSGTDESFLTVESFPQASLDYYRLYRNIEVSSKVIEFLQLQYEQALLDENKLTVNLQQISPPRISDTKIKPKRLTIIILSLFLSTLLTLIALRINQYYELNKELLHSLLKK